MDTSPASSSLSEDMSARVLFTCSLSGAGYKGRTSLHIWHQIHVNHCLEHASIADLAER